MDDFVDHYTILGLPSGEDGAKLSGKEISKAYRSKALEVHPDKRPDDPNAHANFQNLTASYEVLKDEKARKLFDELLKDKCAKIRRRSRKDSKRPRKMPDRKERKRAASKLDFAARVRKEEERITKKLRAEIDRIPKRRGPKAATAKSKKAEGARKEHASAGTELDKERVLKVSWENLSKGYTAERLRELFSKFGEVEDVIRSNKKKASVLVVMSTKDAAVAAAGTVHGDLSNPLLVVPL